MTRIRRPLTALVSALMLIMLLPAAAQAKKPNTILFEDSIPPTDVGFFCGAAPGTVFFSGTSTVRITEFLDRTGNIKRVQLQFNVRNTVTGPNGTATNRINGPDIVAPFDVFGNTTGVARGHNHWTLPGGRTLVDFARNGEVVYENFEIVSVTAVNGQSLDDPSDSGFFEVCAAVA